MTKIERILQEEGGSEPTAVDTLKAPTIIMPEEFDAAYENYSINMTSEEAQKELLDVFILYMIAVTKLNKVANAKIVDSTQHTTDGECMIEKISAPVVIEKINGILEKNSKLLEEWQTMALSSILGINLTEEKSISIDRGTLQKALLSPN